MGTRRRAWLRCKRRGILAGAAGAAVAACADERATETSQLAARGTGALATVRYLTWWPPERMPTIEAWRAGLADERPGIAVETELVPLGKYNARFEVAVAAGTPPDVVLQNSHAQTRWYDAGVHLDLTGLLARDKINLQRDYALMGTELWCGKTYALPMDADANAVFYNRTMLQEAGLRDPWADGKGDWSLDDLIEFARKLTQDTDRDGKLDRWGIAWAYTHPSHVAQLVWTLGGDIADFAHMRYTLDEPLSRKAHQQLYTWLAREHLIISNAEAWAIQKRYHKGNPFRTGRVAFHIRAVADVRQNAREIGEAFDWDVLPFPRLRSGKPGVPLVSGNPHSVVAASQVQEAAYRWAKYIAGPRGQEMLARTQSLPALKSKQGLFLQRPPHHVQVFQDVYTRPYGVHFRHHYTNDAWDVYAAAANRIYAGETPLPEGLREANRLMNEKIEYGRCTPFQVAPARHNSPLPA